MRILSLLISNNHRRTFDPIGHYTKSEAWLGTLDSNRKVAGSYQHSQSNQGLPEGELSEENQQVPMRRGESSSFYYPLSLRNLSSLSKSHVHERPTIQPNGSRYGESWNSLSLSFGQCRPALTASSVAKEASGFRRKSI
jgi:hypothetical protein